MKKLSSSILAITILAITGCTTAGPYITGIDYDGKDSLIVNKCMIKLNGFNGAVTNNNCTQSSIKIK